MRQGVSALIVGLSLLVATVSWAGFTLSRTVLDPGRSERLAEQLLDNPQVREALIVRTTDVLADQVPADIPVRRDLLEAAAEQVIDDPRVEALLVDGLVRVHQNALAGRDEPVMIDGGALAAAARDSLVDGRPALDAVLPPAPVVEVELPTAGLARLGAVKNFVDRYTTLTAVAALFGFVTALAVAKRRAPVLRRVALWGYGAAAFWLLAGFGIPRVAEALSPTSGAIASAAADVFFGAMIRPAVTMAVVATVLLAAGFALPAWERRRGARALDNTDSPVGHNRPLGRPGNRTVDRTDEMPLPVTHRPIVDHSVTARPDRVS
jgi:hypothetical protein